MGKSLGKSLGIGLFLSTFSGPSFEHPITDGVKLPETNLAMNYSPMVIYCVNPGLIFYRTPDGYWDGLLLDIVGFITLYNYIIYIYIYIYIFIYIYIYIYISHISHLII